MIVHNSKKTVAAISASMKPLEYRSSYLVSALLLCVCFLTYKPQLNAQTEPFVEVTITPETVSVSESLNMNVTVFVPTWFKGAPQFPSFEIPNAITRLPPNSSYPGNKRIEGKTWSSITRKYKISPLEGANYRLPAQSIKVSYSNPETNDSIPSDIPLPIITFQATVPVGAESIDPYIAGTSFTLDRQISDKIGELKAGDAITIKHQAKLKGLPSIFIPTLLNDLNIPGVSIYPNSAELEEDEKEAIRTEEITLVFDSGGTFTLPPISFQWWNLTDQKVETATLDAMSFVVTGNTSPSIVFNDHTKEKWYVYLALCTIFGALVIGFKKLRDPIARKIKSSQTKYRETEKFAYKQLCLALHDNDNTHSHQCLLVWTNRIAPGLTSHGLAKRYGSEILSLRLDELAASLYSTQKIQLNFKSIHQELDTARTQALRLKSKTNHSSKLLPLNPNK